MTVNIDVSGVIDSVNNVDTSVNNLNDNLTGIFDPTTLPANTIQAPGETYNDSLTSFYAGLNNSSLLTGLSVLTNSVQFASPVCPSLSFELGQTIIGETVGTTYHCELYSSVSSSLSLVMLVVLSFVAFRVFASA